MKRVFAEPIVAVAAAAMLLQSTAPAQTAADEPASFEQLQRQYDEASAAWASQFSGGRENPPEYFILRYEMWPAWTFIPAIVKAALAEPAPPDSFELLQWYVDLSRAVGAADSQYYAHDRAVMTAMETRHAGDPRIVEVFRDCSYYATPGREALLRACIHKGSTRDIRGLACFYLGDCLRNEAAIAAHWLKAGDPPTDPFQKYATNRRSADFLQFIHTLDTEKAVQDAKATYQRVIDEYGDVAFSDEFAFAAGKQTLAFMARLRLAQMDAVRLGQQAPELAGKDLEGNARKLSDYQGKVVVLHFWATWCPPCIEKLPQLQRLVSEHAKENFCILGVNYDRDRDTPTKFTKENGISWPSWWAIEIGPSLGQWFADGRVGPSTIVLDHKGVVRHHNIEGDELDQAVDSLLRERAADAGNE